MSQMGTAGRCDCGHRSSESGGLGNWGESVPGTHTATVLRVQLGEERADEFRRRHDSLLAGAVADHDGSVVKGLGDGVLALFPSAADAIAASVDMQQAVDSEWGRTPVPAAIRVGLSV